MATGLIDANTLHEDININFRVPENPIEPCQEEYINGILDELVLRTCILGIDARTLIKEYENKSRQKGYMQMNSLYETLRRVGVRISESDYSMLLRKYQVYGMFIQVEPLLEDLDKALWKLQNRQRLDFHPLLVADEILRSHMKVPFPKIKRADLNFIYPKEYFEGIDTSHPSVDRWPKRENVVNTILRIQKDCYTLRKRPQEFFEVYDKNRCGKISREQFLVGLDTLATVSGFHSRLQISQEEAEDIANIYTDTKEPQLVHYSKFVEDLLEVEAPLRLERTPSIPLEENKARELLGELPARFAGHITFSKEELRRLEDAIAFVKSKLGQNKAQLCPFFRSYDKFKHGYVTPVQFRQVMSTVNIYLPSHHSWILTKFYTGKRGFNYAKFLPEVGQEENLKPVKEPKAEEKNENEGETKKIISTTIDPILETEVDTIEGVLQKIKYYVYTRRLRIGYYFEQFDEWKRNVVDRETFMQAMVSAFDFPLSQREYKIIMDMFCDPLEPDEVLYRWFVRVVSEVDWQEGLEKAPLIVPLPYVPDRSFRKRPYSKDETRALENIWKKLAGRVTLRDWDTFMETKTVLNVKNPQSMTRLCLEKVLDRMKLLRLLTPYELDLLFESFAVQRGRELWFDWAGFVRSADIIYRKQKSLL